MSLESTLHRAVLARFAGTLIIAGPFGVMPVRLDVEAH